MRPPRTIRRPVDWILARSTSCFNDVVRSRRASGDRPREPAKVFTQDGRMFGLIEFASSEIGEERWLILPLNPTLAPEPEMVGP